MVAFFLLVIFGILGLTLLGKRDLLKHYITEPVQGEITAYEKKESSMGEFVDTSIQIVNDSFSTCLFGGSYLSGLDNSFNYLLNQNISSKQVFVGKDNWLFYKSETDGNSVSDYYGDSRYTEEELKEIALQLDEIQGELNDMGVDFLLMICPNKEQVMDQYIPDGMNRINNTNSTDQLVQYLRENTTIEVIYPKEEMCVQSEEYDLYYKYDTHWNLLGAFIASEQLKQQITGSREYLQDQMIVQKDLIKHESARDDLAELLNMSWLCRDEQEYQILNIPFSDWTEETFQEADAECEKSVMLLGDSFSIALKPYLSAEYTFVYTTKSREISRKLLEQYQTDVCVIEYVERYADLLTEVYIIP